VKNALLFHLMIPISSTGRTYCQISTLSIFEVQTETIAANKQSRETGRRTMND